MLIIFGTDPKYNIARLRLGGGEAHDDRPKVNLGPGFLDMRIGALVSPTPPRELTCREVGANLNLHSHDCDSIGWRAFPCWWPRVGDYLDESR